MPTRFVFVFARGNVGVTPALATGPLGTTGARSGEPGKISRRGRRRWPDRLRRHVGLVHSLYTTTVVRDGHGRDERVVDADAPTTLGMTEARAATSLDTEEWLTLTGHGASLPIDLFPYRCAASPVAKAIAAFALFATSSIRHML